MIHRGIFPGSAHLIDDRDAMSPPYPQRRHSVQARRMSVQDVRSDRREELLESLRSGVDDHHVVEDRNSLQLRGLDSRAVEVESCDVFLGLPRRVVFRCRQLKRLPPQSPLLAQQRQRAKCVAALQRQRMIQDVENAQAHDLTSRFRCNARTSAARAAGLPGRRYRSPPSSGWTAPARLPGP